MAKANLTIMPNGTFVINKAQVLIGEWRNFSGRPDRFNKSNTDRYFHVALTEDEGQRLKDQGYNVKYRDSRNESEPRLVFLKIFVKLDSPAGLKPSLWLTRKKGNPILMDEDIINQLDADNLERVKIRVRPYDWKLANGTSGRKAMLDRAYFTIEEDEFDAEFYDDSFEGEYSGDEEIPFA